jgi:ARG/rhodanese/phosphatase superfamily protein
MNKRTLALITAVITFSVGVVLARLSLPNLFKTVPPVVTKEIQLSNYRLSGPYQFEDLSIFLIHGPDSCEVGRYTPLEQAMKRGLVTVHETGDVNELAIENVSPTEDIFVQAGDMVKGGRQDRVLSVDMVLPAKSGRVPISAFCVEASRWQQRGVESADQFTLTEMAAPFSLKRAINEVATQAGVWSEVDTAHESVAAGVAGSVRSELSPTSLPLALENEAVQEATKPYVQYLLPLVDRWSDVIGFAFAIDGELKSADVYQTSVMFKQYWPRLLKAAAIEALASPDVKSSSSGLTIEEVGSFLVNSELGTETQTTVGANLSGLAAIDKTSVRTLSIRRETESSLFFESRDTTYDNAWIHRSYLARNIN